MGPRENVSTSFAFMIFRRAGWLMIGWYCLKCSRWRRKVRSGQNGGMRIAIKGGDREEKLGVTGCRQRDLYCDVKYRALVHHEVFLLSFTSASVFVAGVFFNS